MRELRSLLASTPPGGIALVASADGRTNALSLSAPQLFEPLYGPRSAERFQASAERTGKEIQDAVGRIQDFCAKVS